MLFLPGFITSKKFDFCHSLAFVGWHVVLGIFMRDVSQLFSLSKLSFNILLLWESMASSIFKRSMLNFTCILYYIFVCVWYTCTCIFEHDSSNTQLNVKHVTIYTLSLYLEFVWRHLIVKHVTYYTSSLYYTFVWHHFYPRFAHAWASWCARSCVTTTRHCLLLWNVIITHTCNKYTRSNFTMRVTWLNCLLSLLVMFSAAQNRVTYVLLYKTLYLISLVT